MNDPDLLILDEPTAGLDPLLQHEFQGMLREEKEQGKTIFMSSHVMSEVEATCDRVGIIRDGELVTLDTVSHLTGVEPVDRRNHIRRIGRRTHLRRPARRRRLVVR